MNESNVSSPAVFLHAFAKPGVLFDFLRGRHPTLVSGWNGSAWSGGHELTHFGFVGSGRARLSCESGTFELSSGMYFSVPGNMTVEGSGCGFGASLDKYRGMFQLGGPVEESGRLRYIDGCSDTLLIAPPMLGDPCLNLLHIPRGTGQTPHTHPSLRVGMVLAGAGICRTPDGDVRLSPGLVFAIRADGLHSFHTGEHPLRIVAWHPDSDFGPTHESHPMLNRTLVSGRPINAEEHYR